MLKDQYLTGSSELKRSNNDFYKTPEFATKALLAVEQFSGVLWEPACGDGAISKLLPLPVISTDLHDYGFGEVGVDFLKTTKQVQSIITNPPYSLAQEFVEHALTCASDRVAMLLKLNFLETQRRKEFFKTTPLKTVYVFSKRLSFDKGDEKGNGNGLLAYAWFVWQQGYQNKPTIDWI